MPLPVVIAAVAVVGGVAIGAAAAIDGGLKMMKANALVSRARLSHEDGLKGFRVVEHRVQSSARSYGSQQLVGQVDTLGAWVQWLEVNEHRVKLIQRSAVDGVEAQIPNIPPLKAQVVQGISLLRGGAGAAAGAYATYQAALWGVGSFAAASTGTAISGLTGVAATNATLAWLGGGALATGGGGMALGALMLTGIAAAPAALFAGFAVGVEGHRALTQATEIEANVARVVAEMATKEQLLGQIEVRIAELEAILQDVNERAVQALLHLSRFDFDLDSHLEDFQQTALLMRALGEILSTPVVDSEGSLTSESLTIRERYAR